MNGKTLHGLLAATLVFLLWIGAGWAREPAGKSAQAPASITFEGGPGDSLQTAVVIKGAPDHMAGVAAEYQYLENTTRYRNRKVSGISVLPRVPLCMQR